MSRAKRPPADPPEHLDEQARRKWAQVLAILDGRGDPLDTGTLDAAAAYCTAYGRWTAAESQINTLGPVVRSPAGFPVPNPYVGIAAAAARQMRQWGDVLGLHPKAAARTTKTRAAPAKAATAAPASPLANLRVRRA